MKKKALNQPSTTIYTPRAALNNTLNAWLTIVFYLVCAVALVTALYFSGRGILLAYYYGRVQGLIEQHQWQRAREYAVRINKIAPEYRNTNDIYYDSYYQEATQSAQDGDYSAAQLALESLLVDKPDYKDAQEMLCSVWYQPASQLIENEKYTEARYNLLDFLAGHSYCSNVMSLYLQSYAEQADSLIPCFCANRDDFYSKAPESGLTTQIDGISNCS